MVGELAPAVVQGTEQASVMDVCPDAACGMDNIPLPRSPNGYRVGQAAAPVAYAGTQTRLTPVGVDVVGVQGDADDGVFLDVAVPLQVAGTVVGCRGGLLDVKVDRRVRVAVVAIDDIVAVVGRLEVFVLGQKEAVVTLVYLAVERDFYMDAEEAKAYGLIDEVIYERPTSSDEENKKK